MLAGILAVSGMLAAGYYFAVRPVTLRIAVGPANSDDLKVVQALSHAFVTSHSQIRLRPIQTDGATTSAQMIADGKADLAIVRGDLSVPKNAQAVATVRKNVAVLWVPAPLKGKKRAAKITKISQLAGRRVGVVGRTPANVALLKVILQQYGVDPNKVEVVQFATGDAADAIRSQKADAYLAAGPVNSKITSEAIAASTRDGNAPTFLAIDWPKRSRKITRCTRRPKFLPAPLAARPIVPKTKSRRSASRTTSSRARICRKPRLPPSPASSSPFARR